MIKYLCGCSRDRETVQTECLAASRCVPRLYHLRLAIVQPPSISIEQMDFERMVFASGPCRMRVDSERSILTARSQLEIKWSQVPRPSENPSLYVYSVFGPGRRQQIKFPANRSTAVPHGQTELM